MDFSLNKIPEGTSLNKQQFAIKKRSKFSKSCLNDQENICPNSNSCSLTKEELTFKRAKSETFTTKQVHSDFHAKLSHVIRLQNFIKSQLNTKKAKILLYIKKILTERQKCALKIQSQFRKYLCKNTINKIFSMKDDNYCIMYYKTANNMLMPIKQLTAVFQVEDIDTVGKVLKFNYCKMLKCFLLFIKKQSLIKDAYKIVFLSDGNRLIDTNFPYKQNKRGQIYNYIKADDFDECWYISNVCIKRRMNFSSCGFYSSINNDYLKPKRKNTCHEFEVNYSVPYLKGSLNNHSINRKISL